MSWTTTLISTFILSHAAPVNAPGDPFIEKIPGSLVEFKMIPVPESTVEIDGVKHTVKGIAMGQSEVLWDVYDIFTFRQDMTAAEQAQGVDAKARPSKPYGAIDHGFGHAGMPAICISHHGATEFCKWLSKKTGKTYRLPTEAEWMAAAAAGQPMPTNLDEVAWFWDNADDSTHPAGKKKLNAWGFVDMLGNVAEWVNVSETERVVKGGSWKEKAPRVNFTDRMKQTPKWQERDPQTPKSRWWLSDAPFVGFRVVCELP